MAASDPQVIGAPAQNVMETGAGWESRQKFFANKEGLLVKQTMRGCCQECMGCEARSEFKISDMKWEYLQNGEITQAGQEQPDEMYALEKSNFCCRCCWRDGRPFTMVVSEGAQEGGQGIVNFVKPCGCPLYFTIQTDNGRIDIPCCCLLPKVDTTLPSGTPLGSRSRYLCTCNCVPTLEYSEGGEPVYILKPETCCCGCCVACRCCSRGGIMFYPFFFHSPTGEVIGGDYKGEKTPQIGKVWGGLTKECCSTADTFAVMFPENIDATRKAGLLGLTFLLDFTVFERQRQ